MAVDAALRIRFSVVAASGSDGVYHNECGVFTGNGERAANRNVEFIARLVRALSFNHAVLVIRFTQQAAFAVTNVSVVGAGYHLPSMEKAA